jgi:hypothetical protein
VEKNCIEGKQPPEDGCMKPKHVVEEEEEVDIIIKMKNACPATSKFQRNLVRPWK